MKRKIFAFGMVFVLCIALAMGGFIIADAEKSGGGGDCSADCPL